MLVKLRRKFDEIAGDIGPGEQWICHIRQHAVQGVAELMKECAGIVEAQEAGFSLSPALEKFSTLTTIGSTSPSSFRCSRKELIQAPLRFDGRAK